MEGIAEREETKDEDLKGKTDKGGKDDGNNGKSTLFHLHTSESVCL